MPRVIQRGGSRAGTGARPAPGRSAHWAEGSPAQGRTQGPMSAWTWRPCGPGLLPVTLSVCSSLPAACYLFNSAREKEGSPVLRDNAHILAYSPTVCPCHLEIQNHDCLKRGKWRPLTPPSLQWPWGEMPVPFGCVATGTRGWVPHGPGFFSGDFPTSSNLSFRTPFARASEKPLWALQGLMHTTP